MIPAIDISLDSSVLDELSQLEKRLQSTALRKTLVAIAKPIKADMKSRAPRDRGDLARFIGHKTVIDRKRNTAAVFIGLNYRKNRRVDYVTGLMQERGTKHMKAQPFVAPTEATLDVRAIEADMVDFIQMQIDSVVTG